ncbi:MAG TPA: LptA/OstA family protein [Steroidobacteraceae bacterium]
MRQSPTSERRRRLWSPIVSERLAALLLAAASVAALVCPARARAQAQTQAAGSGRAATASQPIQQPLGPQTQQPVEQPSSRQQNQPPIVINAAFSRVDYNTNSVVFENILVSQGDTRLTAARAHAAGVGFANSEWTFEQRVTIELEPRGTLRCDRAVVTFRENRISGATATGEPAEFEQSGAALGHVSHGRADRIVYDAGDDTVRLLGNARFSDARGLEVSGPVLVYDIRNERLQADSAGERRGVHLTITPPGTASREGQLPVGREPGR